MSIHNPTTSPHLYAASQERVGRAYSSQRKHGVAKVAPVDFGITTKCRKCHAPVQLHVSYPASASMSIYTWLEQTDGMCEKCYKEQRHE